MSNWQALCPLKEVFGKTVIPHEDIIEGRIKESTFAVDLQMVVNGTAAEDYLDPVRFFERTHMTNNLQGILRDTLLRVSKNSGSSILVIDTAFGGGKTHALLGIYHLLGLGNEARSINAVEEIMENLKIQEIPSVHLVTIDGRSLSPGGVKKKDGTIVNTLWGEIAYQLKEYNIIRRYDQKMRTTPGSEVMNNLLTSLEKPLVILLDEFAEYLVKARGIDIGKQNLAELTLAFLHEICQVIDGTPRCLLLITLTSRTDPFEKEAEQIRKFVEQIRKITTRIGRVTTPVEREEISAVVRKRLFRKVDENQAKEIAKSLHGFYISHAEYFPEKVRRPEYLQTLENAYPFHPELIDILYGRISTIPEFHLTRGLLRLVSLIIKDVINENPEEEPIIMPYHVSLVNEDILHELTHKLQRGELATVVRIDIANANGDAQAQLIDDGQKSHHIARNVAKSLFLFSLIGSGEEEKGVGAGIRDINLCISLPRIIHPSDVKDVLFELNKRLWYLHERSGYYYFNTEYNINKIIDEYARKVEVQEKLNEIRSRLRQLSSGKYFKEYVWENSVEKIRGDVPVLVLPYFEEIAVKDNDDLPEQVRTLIDMAGTSYRINKNLIYVLVARKKYVELAKRGAARYLAINRIKKDPKLLGPSKEKKKQIEIKNKEENKTLNETLELAYSVVYYAWKNEIKGANVQNNYGTAGNLQSKVFETLKRESKILEKIDPYFVKDRVLKTDAERFGNLFEKFLQTPALPYLSNKQALLEAVRTGVISKHFGLWKKDFIPIPEFLKEGECGDFYYGREINHIVDDYYVVSKDLAEIILQKCEKLSEKSSKTKKREKDKTKNGKKLENFSEKTINDILEFKYDEKSFLEFIHVEIEKTTELSRIKQLLNNLFVGSDAIFKFELLEEQVSLKLNALSHSHLLGVFRILETIQDKILRKNEINLTVEVNSNLSLENDDIDDLQNYLKGIKFSAKTKLIENKENT